jgi:5-methylcytosine-specific restriction protein A
VQPKLTKDGILIAMRRFDSSLRDTVDWKGWEDNKAHRYAVLHRGRKYPVKKIASLASDVAVSDFSGGKHAGHANALLRVAGFDVIALRDTNPDWARDELIIALDFYLKHLPNPPNKKSAAIIGLSKLFNRLGEQLYPLSRRSITFRNPNSVYMKLMNFRRLDPRYTMDGKKGLSGGAKAEEEVWREFAAEPARCDKIARAIAGTLDAPEARAAPPIPELEPEFEEAPEGRLLTRKHFDRERNRSLVKRKKQRAIERTGKLECEVCGFDFALRYGERGEGFIECHHTKPVSTLIEGAKTHIRDLALVCANCHRIIHRGSPWLAVEKLRDQLKLPPR